MRIRTIKPEFYRSEDIAALSRDERLVFIGLWSYVDDNGVGRDHERLVVADLFPFDDFAETFAMVSRALQTLAGRGLITRYMLDGKPFLYVNTWEKHQKIDRPNKERYTPPTSTNTNPRDTLATPSRVLREDVASGTEEQGNRGTEEQKKTSTAPRSKDFDRFWDLYPRKVGKAAAEKAFAKAVAKVGVLPIAAGIKRYAGDPNLPEDRTFIPHPATWLNEGRWEDEAQPARPTSIHAGPNYIGNTGTGYPVIER